MTLIVAMSVSAFVLVLADQLIGMCNSGFATIIFVEHYSFLGLFQKKTIVFSYFLMWGKIILESGKHDLH